MREDFLINGRLYDYSAGGYCGVIMPEHVMKKLAKLNHAYSAEVRKVLNVHKGELYPSSWTLANEMDGGKIKRQVTVKFALRNPYEWDSVETRIKLFTAAQPVYISEFFLVDSREQADEIAREILAEEIERG